MSDPLDLPPFDLIVVGAGTAGLPAAIFAARRGGRVLLLEAAAEIGGTLHFANGQVSAAGTRLQAAKGIQDHPDRHFADVMRISGGHADAAVVRRTVDHAGRTLEWLLGNGLMPLPDHPVTGDSPGRSAYTTPRYFWGANRGRDLLTALRPDFEAVRDRVTLALETRATELLTDSTGRVVGVAANQRGARVTWHGANVLLATGGYAGNADLVRRLVGIPAYTAGACATARGDGLMMGQAIGAGLRGETLHRAGTGSILSTDRYPAQVYARFITAPQERLPWEIWVNTAGARFVREDEPSVYVRERALVRQPALKYAIIFDAAILAEAPPGVAGWDRAKLAGHFGAHPMFVVADTLEDLALRAGLDAAGLARTAAAYNAAVTSGRDTLGREHMPRPIATPPFHAVIHLGHSATSAVGLRVDAQLQVLRTDGTPIPGLYAAGEVLGSGATLGDAFAPGMMLTPALTLGRWLGENLPLPSTSR